MFFRVLVGHRAAVNVVDFDDKYIVSASGDRTIKVKYIFIIKTTFNTGFSTQNNYCDFANLTNFNNYFVSETDF